MAVMGVQSDRVEGIANKALMEIFGKAFDNNRSLKTAGF